jgi:hypothetical protein
MNPGRVFDLTLPLHQVAEGYRAMDERRAVRTLLRPQGTDVMQKRILGRDGLEVSTLGFGCMDISFGYGQPTSREEGVAIIRAAVDGGVRFIDDTSNRLLCTVLLGVLGIGDSQLRERLPGCSAMAC